MSAAARGPRDHRGSSGGRAADPTVLAPEVLSDQGPLFGPEARRLEARAQRSGWITGAGRHDEVRLYFSPHGLPTPDRERLRDSGEARFTRVGHGAAGELELLVVPRETLRRLSGGHAALSALLAAHDAAHRPRGSPRIMGILNVTPDSFSDGGRHRGTADAVEHGLKLFSQGAEILDVGGESTRPGARPVPVEEELDRVIPVVEGLARETDATISIDTTKAAVAARAAEAGASVVNDVSAGRMDPEMLGVVAERGLHVVLMHMRGTPRDMQTAPRYTDVVREVHAELRDHVATALLAGIPGSRISIDPGIGFGKRQEDNLALIAGLPELRSLGLPIVLGVSRKSFLGRLSGEEEACERGSETAAAVALGCALGADVHRVHDVPEARAALLVAHGLVAR